MQTISLSIRFAQTRFGYYQVKRKILPVLNLPTVDAEERAKIKKGANVLYIKVPIHYILFLAFIIH